MLVVLNPDRDGAMLCMWIDKTAGCVKSTNILTQHIIKGAPESALDVNLRCTGKCTECKLNM